MLVVHYEQVLDGSCGGRGGRVVGWVKVGLIEIFVFVFFCLVFIWCVSMFSLVGYFLGFYYFYFFWFLLFEYFGWLLFEHRLTVRYLLGIVWMLYFGYYLGIACVLF